MVTRAQIVAEARSWIGTPIHHQQHTKGVAVDCVGLVGGVGMELGIYDRNPAGNDGASEFFGYSRIPDGHTLLRACNRFLVPITREEMQPGDAIVVKWGNGAPQHFGILGDHKYGTLSIIHAESFKHKRVMEHRLVFGRHLRFVAAFSYPGVE